MRPAINGAKWFTTPLDCPHSHPARNCPDMTSALNELIAGATTVESCRSSAAEMTQVLHRPMGRFASVQPSRRTTRRSSSTTRTERSGRGVAAAKELDEISEGIVLVSMPGHTRGHHCVAVDAGHRWVLHCGDAFYHHGTLDGQSQVPSLLTRMEILIAFDRKRVLDNHSRLPSSTNAKRTTSSPQRPIHCRCDVDFDCVR